MNSRFLSRLHVYVFIDREDRVNYEGTTRYVSAESADPRFRLDLNAHYQPAGVLTLSAGAKNLFVNEEEWVYALISLTPRKVEPGYYFNAEYRFR
jgi:outer membrane receptor protein involved in Fe transport